MTPQSPTGERAVRLITEAVGRLSLDLRGLTVLTEAGSGHYAVTPAIAVAAGADRVIAVTRNSLYGLADEVIAGARRVAKNFERSQAIEFVVGRPTNELLAAADVVTNLGFVRPIDGDAVAVMKPTAAVPLMCEAWELRPGDVDVDACRRNGILVLGTNEDAVEVDVFGYSGTLAVRLVLDAGLEVRKCRIVVFGPDRFGPVIERALAQLDAEVTLVSELKSAESRAHLSGADALLVAAYSRNTPVIGLLGDVAAETIGTIAPDLTVVQFAGAIDHQALRDVGVRVFPESPVGAVRMARTLAHLGPRPVIDLHASGLKVGELACRARLSGIPLEDAENWLAARYPIVQLLRLP